MATWIPILIASALWLSGACAAADSAGDVVVVLDNSGSMKKNDPGFAVKDGVASLFDGMDGDDRMAVVVFDQGVRLVLPLTPRASITNEVLNESLAHINYRGRYTDIPAALERSLSELKQNGRPDANRSIVFLTDGMIDTGNARNDREGARWVREELVADAARQGIRLYAVAVGRKNDFKLLHSLAQNTGGEYYRADERGELLGVLERIGSSLAASWGEPAGESFSPSVDASQDLDVPAPVATQDPMVEGWEAPSSGDSAVETAVPSDAHHEPVEAPAGEQTRPRGSLAPFVIPSADLWRPWGPWLAGLGVSMGLLLLVLLGRRKGRRVSAAEQVFATHRANTKPFAFLYDLRDETRQTRHPLTTRPTLIGRSGPGPGEHADHLLLDRPEVSCRHAIVQYRTLAYWLIDQGSTNGTFVNGRRVTGEVRLKHRDRIRFHDLEFEFEWPDLDDAAAKTRIVRAQGLGADQRARSDPGLMRPRAAAFLPGGLQGGSHAAVSPKDAGIRSAAKRTPAEGTPADRHDARATAHALLGESASEIRPAESQQATPKPLDESLTLPTAREVKRALKDYFDE